MKSHFRITHLQLPTLMMAVCIPLAGCAGYLFKPNPITQSQLRAAGVSNSRDIQKARQGVAAAKKKIPESERAYASARQDVNLARKRVSAARQYLEWQRLKEEKAQVGKNLAQARVSLAQARVAAAKAQAIAAHQAGKDDGLDVGQYQHEVINQEQRIASMKQHRSRLDRRIGKAHRKYVAAERALPAKQREEEKGKPASTSGEGATVKSSGKSTESTQNAKNGGGSEGGNTAGGGSSLQWIHPAGKVINQQPLEAQPGKTGSDHSGEVTEENHGGSQ